MQATPKLMSPVVPIHGRSRPSTGPTHGAAMIELAMPSTNAPL
jgi:hypothetical protein